jgi:hypothetical protein
MPASGRVRFMPNVYLDFLIAEKSQSEYTQRTQNAFGMLCLRIGWKCASTGMSSPAGRAENVECRMLMKYPAKPCVHCVSAVNMHTLTPTHG